MFKVFKKSMKSRKSEEEQLDEETMSHKIASQLESQKKGFSVSHSGRYKAKYKQRTAISDGLYKTDDKQRQTDRKSRQTDRHPAQQAKQGTSSGQGAKSPGSTSSRSSSGPNSNNNTLNKNLKSSRPRISDLDNSDPDKARAAGADTHQATSL